MKFLILISLLIGSTAGAQNYLPQPFNGMVNNAQQNPMAGIPSYNYSNPNPVPSNFNSVPLQPVQVMPQPAQPNVLAQPGGF